MQVTLKGLESQKNYIFSKEVLIDFKSLDDLVNDQIFLPNSKPSKAKPLLQRSVAQGCLKNSITLPDGGLYEGEHQDKIPHGFGVVTFSNQCTYEGSWSYGERCGQGTTYRSDGSKNYEGEWKHDKPWGFGTAYRRDGTKIYEGEWENGHEISQKNLLSIRI